MAGSFSLPRMREDARRIFQAGIRAADPYKAVLNHCRLTQDVLHAGEKAYPLAGVANVYVIGAGKAAARMAQAGEHLLGSRINKGLITVKYGHGRALAVVEAVEAGHPIPDANGLAAARRILDLARKAGPDDLIICLLSGGGSALLPLPVSGISLEETQETIRVLLSSGAAIGEINAIRKHLSAIKGGRLAQAAYPATMLTLILSDVVGDRLDVIASGPTVADATTFQDCLDAIHRYGLQGRLPETVRQYLENGRKGRADETPKQGHPAFAKCHNRIIANNTGAILAAKAEAAQLGYAVLFLSSMIEGETRDVAGVHAAIAREVLKSGHPVTAPACILSGGETTVTIQGDGLGGRNQEFVLAAAPHIAGHPQIVVLSGGTDGTDGPTDAAGAIADHDTLARAAEKGLHAARFLRENDAYHYFEPLGDLIKTGPTHTNVMDLRVLLVAPPA